MQITDEELVGIQKGVLDKLRFHFILNTLNAVQYYINNDSQKAYDMVYLLAKYLVGKCDSLVNNDIVPVEEELNYAHAYAKLEEIQRGRLTVNWNVKGITGFVRPGSIYQEIEKLLKEEVFVSRECRTLEVYGMNERPGICIRIKEVDKLAIVPTCSMEADG